MIIVPEMVGSVVGVHNGSGFTQVEIKVCIAPSWIWNFSPAKHVNLSVGRKLAAHPRLIAIGINLPVDSMLILCMFVFPSLFSSHNFPLRSRT